MYLRNWDLAQLGSPTMQTLISPRRLMPSCVSLCTPPNSIRRIARFMSWWPKTVGATLLTKRSYICGVWDIRNTSAFSSSCNHSPQKSVKAPMLCTSSSTTTTQKEGLANVTTLQKKKIVVDTVAIWGQHPRFQYCFCNKKCRFLQSKSNEQRCPRM